MANKTFGPRTAPTRVDKITSPEPINSPAHTDDDPTIAKKTRPVGGNLLECPFLTEILSGSISIAGNFCGSLNVGTEATNRWESP